MYYLSILFVFIVSLYETIDAKEASSTPVVTMNVASLVEFKNAKKEYAFKYPSNWIKNKDASGMDIFILAPKDANGHSLANLSVISGEVPKEVDLNIFIKENIKNLISSDSAIKVISEGDATIGKIPAKWIRYKKKNQDTEIMHYFLVTNNLGIVVTFGAEQTMFDLYQPTFDNIIKSFNFNN